MGSVVSVLKDKHLRFPSSLVQGVNNGLSVSVGAVVEPNDLRSGFEVSSARWNVRDGGGLRLAAPCVHSCRRTPLSRVYIYRSNESVSARDKQRANDEQRSRVHDTE